MSFLIERYTGGSYGGMCQRDDGRYVDYYDVCSMLQTELGQERAMLVIAQYFVQPEVEEIETC